MARIRSIHPAIFTDETFVTLGHPARLLWIGLWCEADDQGVFGWKPLSLHMRLTPTAKEDVAGLLEELAAANCVRRFDIDGRPYGVIRNFVRHQRPKRPREYHPLPDELRSYAGFNEDGSRPDATTGRKRFDAEEGISGAEPERVPNRVETRSGSRSQMETETETETETEESLPNGRGASAPASPTAVTALPDWRERLFRQGLASVTEMTGKPIGPARTLIGKWLRDAKDDARKVLRTIEDAQEQNAAEPVAWIEAALKARPAQRSDSLQFTMGRG
ncbi:hypothetical protein [Bosea sp. UC22_33]|uniref:hypothetical protein n=1 Tax=Bosea sp. UC22_33 TaxID=3350165 RepID=UPI00366E74E0